MVVSNVQKEMGHCVATLPLEVTPAICSSGLAWCDYGPMLWISAVIGGGCVDAQREPEDEGAQHRSRNAPVSLRRQFRGPCSLVVHVWQNRTVSFSDCASILRGRASESRDVPDLDATATILAGRPLDDRRLLM
jgi:hypothetical protein